MEPRSRSTAAVLLAVLAGPLGAQQPATPPLFASHEPLALTLRADFDSLMDDREDEPWRPAEMRVGAGEGGAPSTLAARLRTRGNFRRETCALPPLRVDLGRAETEGTAFEGQDELKLVGICRPGRDAFEQLVLSEYLAYRAHALVTDRSFRVRLARITYVDRGGADEPFTHFAFFLEHEDALAARLGGLIFELPEGKNLPIGAFEPVAAATAAIFQYMIGNGDWSEVAGHNVEIVDRAGAALVVPYDFDFSGLVDAPYAVPPSDLPVRSVRERVYRGWCWGDVAEAGALARFRAAAEPVLGLARDFPYLEGGNRTRILLYLEAFFEDVETDERARRRFLRDCRPLVG